MSTLSARAARPTSTHGSGHRVMPASWWTLDRGAMLAGIVAAMLLLGLFHAVVAGAVQRQFEKRHGTTVGATQAAPLALAATSNGD